MTREVLMRLKLPAIFILLAAVAAFGGFMQRPELPYRFDLFQTGDGVAIVNQDTWNQNPLLVKVTRNDRPIVSGIIAPRDQSRVLRGIPTSGEIKLTISRRDLIGRLRYQTKTLSLKRLPIRQTYVVLVGASIGKAWHLQDFTRRTGEQDVVFSNRAHYSFDKTDTIEALLHLKVKPDAVILKECSDYFPRNQEKSTSEFERWIERIKKNHVTPILATTTPVSAIGPKKDKQPSIDLWNAFIREYGHKNRIPVLDLARVLQTSPIDTFLKQTYAKDDGYHLTAAAYRTALDPLLIRFTRRHLEFYN